MSWPNVPGPVQGIILAGDFDPNFLGWLNDNWHVWKAFYIRASQMMAYRSHYGSRAIIEVLRFESAITDNGEPWKINNNCTAQLARLFNAVTGSEFFMTRDRAA